MLTSADAVTTKCDIHAFGIALLEMYLEGHRPYPGWEQFEVWMAVENGYIHPKPPAMPEEVYAVAQACLSGDDFVHMGVVEEALQLAQSAMALAPSTDPSDFANDTHLISHRVVNMYSTSLTARAAVLQQLAGPGAAPLCGRAAPEPDPVPPLRHRHQVQRLEANVKIPSQPRSAGRSAQSPDM